MVTNFRTFLVITIIFIFCAQKAVELDFACLDKDAKELAKPTNIPNVSSCKEIFDTPNADQICLSACGPEAATLRCKQENQEISEFTVGCPPQIHPTEPQYTCHNNYAGKEQQVALNLSKEDRLSCTELEAQFHIVSEQAVENIMSQKNTTQEDEKMSTENEEEENSDIDTPVISEQDIKQASQSAYRELCEKYCGGAVEWIECNDGISHNISCIMHDE